MMIACQAYAMDDKLESRDVGFPAWDGRYAPMMQDTLEAFLQAKTPADVYRQGHLFFEAQGVAHLNYVHLITPAESGEAGVLDFWTNMPAHWMEIYAQENMGERDYIIRRSVSAAASAFTYSAERLHYLPGLTRDEQQVVRACCEENRLSIGLAGVLPTLMPGRITSYLLGLQCPVQDGEALLADRGSLFLLLMMALHERMADIRQAPDGCGGTLLTAREQTVLQGMAQGETGSRISDRLHVAESTVSVHLSNARRKLGARTNDQAMIRAILAGLVDP